MSGLSRAGDAAERPAEARPWPGARLSLWNADTLATHAHSADIIWLNNALHRLLPEDPGLLATLQQLAVPGALLYVMEFRQLTPSALLSTLLLTNGQPEALLHNSADWAALFSAAGFNCQHGDEVAGLQRFLVQCPTGRCAAIPVNFRPPSPGVCRGGWCRNGSYSSTPYR